MLVLRVGEYPRFLLYLYRALIKSVSVKELAFAQVQGFYIFVLPSEKPLYYLATF